MATESEKTKSLTSISSIPLDARGRWPPATLPAIVFLATSWGAKHGGVNSINFDLVTEVSKLTQELSVACIVAEISAEEHKSAKGAGISLFVLGLGSSDSIPAAEADRIDQIIDSSRVSWWIGHDIFTGEVALALRSRHPSSKTAIFLHSSYSDYQSAKKKLAATDTAKEQDQRRILKRADACFAVGPLLHERLLDSVSPDRGHLFIPGLEERNMTYNRSKLSAVAFGRLDKQNDIVKQMPLAVEAFCTAINQARRSGFYTPALQNATLKLIGVGSDARTRKSILEQIDAAAGGCVEVKLLPYISDRQRLADELDGANLSLVLSWHDGFGLTAWESIANGIPLVLSKNTGVYRLLSSIGGMATGCVESVDIRGSFGQSTHHADDVTSVQHAIVRAANGIDQKLKDARSLSRLLVEQRGFTWQNSANLFLNALGMAALRRPQDVLNLEISPAIRIQIDEQRARSRLEFAQELCRAGFHHRALEEVSAIAPQLGEFNLDGIAYALRAEIFLRLNRHHASLKEAESALRYCEADPCECVKLNGIVNTLQRATGLYTKAIDTARRNIELSETRCPQSLGGAMRDLARSLALAGEWEEGVGAAKAAYGIANSADSTLDKAKSLLALGEAHRHGFAQQNAILAYRQSGELALAARHYSCFIWAALGCADSLFLTGNYDSSRTQLESVRQIVDDPMREFPLEKLHCRLSELSLDIARNSYEVPEVRDRCLSLIEAYRALGAHWTVDYIAALARREYSIPKKF